MKKPPDKYVEALEKAKKNLEQTCEQLAIAITKAPNELARIDARHLLQKAQDLIGDVEANASFADTHHDTIH